MKNNIFRIGLLFLFSFQIQAQYNQVTPTSNQISDNLDLRAVASMFGDASNLEDFERRINDPKYQISNLDLNNDRQVDYLRVVESIERNTHLVIIQSVLDYDIYQDVATIDIDRDYNNRVQVQIVGNNFIYGANCIYEPVYYHVPVIYTSLYTNNYRPYTSIWRWNYYPKTYRSWETYAVYRYKNNLQVSINFLNNYNYVNYRRNNQAVALYQSRRSNGYEHLHPEHHFSKTNKSYANSYELEHRSQPNYKNNSNAPREYAYSKNYDPANRYGASRPTYSQRPEDRSDNKMSTSRESSPKTEQNRKNYANNRSENLSRESNKQTPQTNRDNALNNNTRENNQQNQENSNRGNNLESERQRQSSNNTHRRT